MKVSHTHLTNLLEYANAMRAAKGDDLLGDLPPSDYGNPRSCLIANAFNYGCKVFPSNWEEEAVIYFKTKKDAETYCSIVKIDKSKIINRCARFKKNVKSKAYAPGNYIKAVCDTLKAEGQWEVPLTDELNFLAKAFDVAQLPKKYYR